MTLTVQESVQQPSLQNVCNSVVEPKIFLLSPVPRNRKSELQLREHDLNVNNGIKIVTVYKRFSANMIFFSKFLQVCGK
jgi:hypothetical protein